VFCLVLSLAFLYSQIIPNFKDMIQRIYPEAVARRQKEREHERQLKQDKLKLAATTSLQQILLPGNLRPSSSSLTQVILKKTSVSSVCLCA
jgi:hypothetical protein